MRCILVSAAGLLVIAGSAGSSIGWGGGSGVGGPSSVTHADSFIVTETLKLVANAGAVGDGFGHSVARDGNVVVVGAPLADDTGSESGAAYVFVLPPGGGSGTLTEAARLRPSDGSAGDWFGVSVAIDGDTVAVGAYFGAGSVSGSGAAYVFERPPSGWSGTITEVAKLRQTNGIAYGAFGSTVAIDGDVIVCGCLDRGAGPLTGAAYVFTRPGGGWSGTLTEDATLLESDVEDYDQYGDSVAIDGETVVVGAPAHSVGSVIVGVAYVFVDPPGGWSGTIEEAATLLPPDPVNDGYFGDAVAIADATVVVGSSQSDVGTARSGAAYVFEEPAGGWSGAVAADAMLAQSDPHVDDNFGAATAIEGEVVAIGAWGRDETAPNSGAAYLFTRPAAGWSGTLEENATLVPSDAAEDDLLGISVAVAAGTAVVGAEQNPFGNAGPGAAYVFDASTVFADGFESGDLAAWSAAVP